MRITRIEATPYFPPLRQFFGRNVKVGFGELKNIEFGLVRIHTDEGIVGLRALIELTFQTCSRAQFVVPLTVELVDM